MEPIELLEQVLGRKSCLVGIGNSLRSDDGLGPYLIESLRAGLPEGTVDLLVVDDVPENFAFPISRMDVENVIFVDAVIAEGPPGTVLFGPMDDFEEVGQTASTHKLALRLSGRVIADAGKNVFFLGVVPGSTAFGKDMTPRIKEVVDELARLVTGFLGKADVAARGEAVSADPERRI